MFVVDNSEDFDASALCAVHHYGFILKGSCGSVFSRSVQAAIGLFKFHGEVRSRERYFREIFDSASDAIFIHDYATGDILDVNNTVLRLYGFDDRKNLLETGVSNLSAVEAGYDNDRVREMFRRAIDGGKTVFEWMAKKKSGEAFWVEVVLHIIEVGGERKIMATVRDISDRKQMRDELERSRIELQQKNEELMAMNEEMEAANEELVAVNEEMEAANEELIAVNHELQMAEEKYRGVVETQSEMIARFLDDGTFTFVNTAWKNYYKERLGFNTEVIGSNIADVMQIKNYDQVHAYLSSLKPGQLSSTMERRFVAPDGKTYWQLWYLQKIIDEKRNITEYQVVGNDITERKLAELSLRESEENFRLLIDLAPDSILRGSPEGIIIGTNQSACEVTGYSHDELIGRNITGLFSIEEQKRVPFRFDLLRQGKVVRNDRIITRKDGSEVFIEMISRMMPDGTYLAFVRDITERKEAEEAISAEKERLAVTLRSIGDGVITTDTQGRVMVINRVAEELTGWKQDEAWGRPLAGVFRIIDEISRVPFDNPVGRILETGEIIEMVSHTLLVSRDGTERIIADSGAPIKDKNNATIGVVLVFRDMTEKKKLTEVLQQTDKLNSLGVLAGGIAHDFNNLLGGIFGYIEMARIKSRSDNTVSGYLDKAMMVYNRARDLTQQLLTFSKGGMPEKKTGNMGMLLRNSVSFALSGSNIICEYRIDDNLKCCDFDENQMGQVIDNIIINAKQAMPIGGTVIISAKNCTLARGDNPVLDAGEYINISIADTGIGIPPDLLKRIFDPFFTTKQQGTGLGLATCYSIVQKHGGYIEVESVQGRGTVFNILLPVSKSILPEHHAGAMVEHRGSGFVIVMDDEDFIREIAGEMLAGMGYTVFGAVDGHEAVELWDRAEAGGKHIVAAFFDLTIPGGMGGGELIAEIRSRYPDIPVFASSGFSEDRIMSDPADYGFTASIRKPYRLEEISEIMNRYVKSSDDNDSEK